MMPSIKRQASESFSTPNQSLVKRQKSSTDLNDNTSAVTVAGAGRGQNGTLVPSVRIDRSGLSGVSC